MNGKHLVDELAHQIGTRIRAFRDEHGLSQTDLADRAGIQRQQLSRYESGKEVPRLRNAMALARFMGILVDELVNGKNDEDIRVACPILRERFVIIDRMNSERRNAAADLMDMFIMRELQHKKESKK